MNVTFMKKFVGIISCTAIGIVLSGFALFLGELTSIPIYGAHFFHAFTLKILMLMIVSIFGEWATKNQANDLLIDLLAALIIAAISTKIFPISSGAGILDNLIAMSIPMIAMGVFASCFNKSEA